MKIEYVTGDATRPIASGNKIIAHVCNDRGGWGKGFVVAISRRWPEPEAAYRAWYAGQQGFSLGEVQFIQVEHDIWVANMLGQEGMGVRNGVPPIRYEAVKTCLGKVADKTVELAASVHMPRIGCGLAGGDWSVIEPIIEDVLVQRGVPTKVYDFG